MQKDKVHIFKHQSQKGFAAIVVTLIVMTIVVLLVIGFVAIVNRESRSSIDQQLSSQAFYAAETGVNDAAQLIADETSTLTKIETCDEFDSSSLAATKQLDDNVEYTCVLVDSRPDSLDIQSVKTDNPTVLLIKPVDDAGTPVALKSLTISWQAEDVPDTVNFPGAITAAGDTFPADASLFGSAPVLRAAITNLNDLNRQDLVENTYTFFLRPQGVSIGNNVPLADGPTNQGEVIGSYCTESGDPRFCSKTITGFDSSFVDQGNDEGFLLVLRSFYINADVHVVGIDVNDNEVLFEDQQAVIDSTGRANDVLRRVQARVPIRNQYNLPGGPETSKLGGVCKLLQLTPGSAEVAGGPGCGFWSP